MERQRTVRRNMVDVRLNAHRTSEVPLVKVRKLLHIIFFTNLIKCIYGVLSKYYFMFLALKTDTCNIVLVEHM